MQQKFLFKGYSIIFNIMIILLSSLIILFLIFNFTKEDIYIKPNLPINDQSSQNFTSSKTLESIDNTILEQSNFGLPMNLKIPKINVDADIKHLGITINGEMNISDDPADVSWYNLGPRPGEIGTAVIAGHYGVWKNGKISVFNNLNKLNKGDKIYIEDDKGIIISFVVREIKKYNFKTTDTSDIFISNDGKSHLNIITCEGTWDKIQKIYSNRLVVFTDKE